MQRLLDIPLPVDAQLHESLASKYPTGAGVVLLTIIIRLGIQATG